MDKVRVNEIIFQILKDKYNIDPYIEKGNFYVKNIFGGYWYIYKIGDDFVRFWVNKDGEVVFDNGFGKFSNKEIGKYDKRYNLVKDLFLEHMKMKYKEENLLDVRIYDYSNYYYIETMSRNGKFLYTGIDKKIRLLYPEVARKSLKDNNLNEKLLPLDENNYCYVKDGSIINHSYTKNGFIQVTNVFNNCLNIDINNNYNDIYIPDTMIITSKYGNSSLYNYKSKLIVLDNIVDIDYYDEEKYSYLGKFYIDGSFVVTVISNNCKLVYLTDNNGCILSDIYDLDNKFIYKKNVIVKEKKK